MNQTRILFFAAILIGLSNCALDKFQQETFDGQYEKWKAHNITDYTYTHGENCACNPQEDIKVTVTNGVVTAAIYDPSGIEITGSSLNDVRTIEDIFDLLQDAINNDNLFFLNMQFHKDYGFPELLEIDADESIDDDRVLYSIRDFMH